MGDTDLALSAWAIRRTFRKLAPPWPPIATFGVWNSPSFAGYFDLAPEVDACVRHLFLSSKGFGSASDDESCTLGYMRKPFSRRADGAMGIRVAGLLSSSMNSVSSLISLGLLEELAIFNLDSRLATDG